MKTTPLVMLGLMTALALAAGPAAADDAPSAGSECPPVWIDSDNKVRYDLECLDIPPSPVFDNSP